AIRSFLPGLGPTRYSSDQSGCNQRRWKLGVNRPTTQAMTATTTSKRKNRPIRRLPLVISVIAPLDQRRGGGTFLAPLDGLAAPFRGGAPFWPRLPRMSKLLPVDSAHCQRRRKTEPIPPV